MWFSLRNKTETTSVDVDIKINIDCGDKNFSFGIFALFSSIFNSCSQDLIAWWQNRRFNPVPRALKLISNSHFSLRKIFKVCFFFLKNKKKFDTIFKKISNKDN